MINDNIRVNNAIVIKYADRKYPTEEPSQRYCLYTESAFQISTP